MTLEKPRSGESFATDVALVVETVSQDVHGEGRHADVHLPAHQALLGCARAQTQVGLLVSEHHLLNINTKQPIISVFGCLPRQMMNHTF